MTGRDLSLLQGHPCAENRAKQGKRIPMLFCLTPAGEAGVRESTWHLGWRCNCFSQTNCFIPALFARSAWSRAKYQIPEGSHIPNPMRQRRVGD
ncbi:MAG: hypothetical protein ACKO6I_04340 [Sphingomonadales bacterium]